MSASPPIAAATGPAGRVFDWTDLFDFLPWRVKLGCIVIFIVGVALLLLWANS